MSGTARVIINEIDQTQRVSGQSDAFVAGVIPSVRGPLDPTLVNTITNLYNFYTPEGKYKTGYDLSYIEFESYLKKASKAYINRAYNSPKYSAATVYKSTSSKQNAPILYPLSSPDLFEFTTNNGRPLVNDSSAIFVSAEDKVQVSALFFEKSITGDAVKFFKSAPSESFPPEIIAETTYYLVKLSANFISLSSTKANALLESPLIQTLSDNGNGTFTIKNIEVESAPSDDQPLVLFHSADPGEWGNLIEIKTVNYSSNQVLVREPNSFQIEIFYKGASTGETFVCSFDRDKKDRSGQSIFIEESLKRSNYVRAKVHPQAASNSIIKENSTISLEFALGQSDSSISEADLIKALQPFRNKQKYKIQFICDFGITLPNFQKEIISICETRGDCGFILSTPLSAQQSPTSAILDIVSYKTSSLNSASNYGVIFAGHVKKIESQTGRDVWLSPSSEMLANYVKLWDSGTPWEIAANENGIIDANDVYVHLEEGDQSVLLDNGINPIRFSYGEGIKAWGERTLQIAPTAFDRMHVRNLINYMKPSLDAALRPYLFSLNNVDDTDSVLSTIKNVVEIYLESVEAQGGIYGSSVVCGSENNTTSDVINNTVNIDVYFSPIYSIEKIKLSLIANNNFITFAN